MRGKAWRGSDVSFGDYGLRAMEPCWLTDRQIEAARVAMTRFIKRGGKIWVRVFPDKPITKKPQESRMGKGKGAPEQWVCVVRPGRILFEMEGGGHRLRRAKRSSWRRRSCPFSRSSRPGSPRRRRHDRRGGLRDPFGGRPGGLARRSSRINSSGCAFSTLGQLDAPVKCALRDGTSRASRRSSRRNREPEGLQAPASDLRPEAGSQKPEAG